MSIKSMDNRVGKELPLKPQYMACSICKHPDIDTINEELTRGMSFRSVAAAHRVKPQALNDHWKAHVLVLDGGASEIGMTYITLNDVLNIPLAMKERAQLIDALMERALEPLYKEGRYTGLKYTQTELILGLMRIQQRDEQTILKITGVLPGDERSNALMENQQYAKIGPVINAALLRISEGDSEKAAEARLIIAEGLMPMDQIQRPKGSPSASYKDMGVVLEGDLVEYEKGE